MRRGRSDMRARDGQHLHLAADYEGEMLSSRMGVTSDKKAIVMQANVVAVRCGIAVVCQRIIPRRNERRRRSDGGIDE